MLLGLFASMALTYTSALDAIGSYGCTAPACVFANSFLRFGTGSENSVNSWGLFVQPWYYSQTSNAWYKLTYSSYPLDTAIGTGYGSSHWSGTSIVDLYSLTRSSATTDYSEYIVDSSDSAKSVGHGKIVANRTFTIAGTPIILQNTFSLGLNDSYVKIVTRVINNGTSHLNNVIIWTGTRDDFVGTTDVNTKIRGNLDTGSFVPITANNQSSRAIMIKNTDEGVLFYSETQNVMMSYASCCSFSNAFNTYPLSLPPMTTNPTDGSYSAVLPFGNITYGGSGSITWYYAAGAVNSLNAVAQSVATAQMVDAGTVISTSSSPSVSPSPTPTYTVTQSSTSSPTTTVSAYPTQTPTQTTTQTQSQTQTATQTPTQTPSQTPTQTQTQTPSQTSSQTQSQTSSQTQSQTSSQTQSQTPSQTQSQTPPQTQSQTPAQTTSSTLTASLSCTPTSTFPVKIILVQQPIINETKIYSFPTYSDNKNDALLYIVGFVPIFSLLGCLGCICAIAGICLYYKKKRDKPAKENEQVQVVEEKEPTTPKEVKIRVPKIKAKAQWRL